jgi:hypothetical protein
MAVCDSFRRNSVIIRRHGLPGGVYAGPLHALACLHGPVMIDAAMFRV